MDSEKEKVSHCAARCNALRLCVMTPRLAARRRSACNPEVLDTTSSASATSTKRPFCTASSGSASRTTPFTRTSPAFLSRRTYSSCCRCIPLLQMTCTRPTLSTNLLTRTPSATMRTTECSSTRREPAVMISGESGVGKT